MLKIILNRIAVFFFRTIPSFFFCLVSGIKYNKTYYIVGKLRVIKKSRLKCAYIGRGNGTLLIGNGFRCNNLIKSNSIGLIQPCVFNISYPGSAIVIGDNVGISGSTLSAKKFIKLGTTF